MSTQTRPSTPDPSLTLSIGDEQLVIGRRYQAASIVNDILIGVWFLAGSVLFFYPELEVAGTWLFVAGSTQLLIRPIIRLSHLIHVRRQPGSSWDL
ncbi:MAG: YrhK family protein [Arenicellales bacterium]